MNKWKLKQKVSIPYRYATPVGICDNQISLFMFQFLIGTLHAAVGFAIISKSSVSIPYRYATLLDNYKEFSKYLVSIPYRYATHAMDRFYRKFIK